MKIKKLPIRYQKVRTVSGMAFAHSHYKKILFNVTHVIFIVIIFALAAFFLSFKDNILIIAGSCMMFMILSHVMNLFFKSDTKLFGNLLYYSNPYKGYDFVLFKEQYNIHPKAPLRQIFRNREMPFIGLFFEWGNRNPPEFFSRYEKLQVLQLFPIYFYRLNTEHGIGVGFWTYFVGIKYSSKHSDFTRKRISFYGQLPKWFLKLFK